MTENIPLNKSTNSVYEYSNSFDVSVNSNLDNNVLQHSKLNGDVSGQPESGNTCGGVNDKKSFHITSVTVQHNSTEGNADESADESRTEELSDNIDMSAVDVQTDGADLTDNIIGKDDVLYKVTSVGSAPIIPTSAQYGIAVVSNCNNDLPDNISKFVPNDGKLNDTVKRTEFIANGLEINGNNIVPKELNTQIKNERFKVVKIESNEPFKRGRWVCMDFSDQSMDQLKKSTISINDNDKSAKKDTPEKEICPAEVLVNGTVNMENMSSNKDTNHGAVVNEAELKVTQTSQVNDSAYHNGDMSGMNSVSPNQTFSASFVPPSNVSQPQAQSLTHIIVPQSAPTQVASGSYGHSQSLPHSELQHVHQAAAQQQQQQQQQQQPSQQGIHVVTSLQQSFHPHPSMQHSQGMMTQGMQHMGGQQQQQQQSDNVYSQPAQQSSISVQQQPMMQQQSYPTLQQNTMTQQPAQCTNQRVPTNAQPQQQQQMSNPHCLSQIPQQQSGQQNGDGMMSQQNQSAQYQQSQSQQTMQQTLQHTMQQVPLQQQSFQHTVPAQSSQPPMIHQQQPVQPMPTQHHSPQQPQQQQQTNQPQQSMPTQQNPTSQQVSSQSSLPPTNIQQPVMQQNVPHSLPQQQQTVPAPANVQYLSQQQQPTVIPQANQQPGQQVINAPPVQQQPMMQQQMQPNADPQLHMSVQQQLQHQSQPLPQSGQQQQILQQQMPSQMPQQQQQSQMQQMQHIPQQTQPQMNQQPATQQQPMQQQQIPQQIAQHHQQIIQPVPQQQQAPQQQPQQMMQSQQMAPQTQAAQQIPVQQPATFQNAQQPSQPPSQQVAAQVMVGNQQIPQMQQQQQAPQQQSHQMQQPPSSQPIQHSFPPQQVQQPTYQSPVPHQNVSGQLTENIPVSGAQTASYQHDVSVLPTDVMMSNVQPSPNQYAIGQPQNISVQTQLPLHVSLHQSYQTANQPHYVNASNVGMLSNCNTSMAGQQTPPISQPQYFSHSVTQSGGSITSQDLQQLCGHQHHQANQNVSSLVAPLISTVSSQNLPPNVDYGQQYSVHYQNGTQSQSSTNVQTQTTPISQSCSTTGVPMQQFTIQQSIPSVLSSAIPVPVSSSYLPNIGSVHPNQLQQTNYLQNVATPPNQMYSAHQTNVSFADAVDQYHLPNVHLPEQVSENVKVGEEVNFHRHDDADSTAGGSNAVAIDNKIEQAMDLVKSHLMFAVREEVEVLKEKIAELMDRINQLEIENSILKANASQETLAQLPTHTAAPSTVVSNTTNSTPASIGPTNGQPP